MKTPAPKPPARFGALLGTGPGNVPVFSSHYPSVDEREYPDHHAYRSYVDGIFMGYKWQCVELARRWLYINKGYIFDDVAMAYDIFHLRSVRVIKDNSRLPLKSFRNGSRRHPEPGCLLIWDEGGEFERTGHVAIVTEVQGNTIRFIEQNVDHVEWHHERDYSRELKATLGPDGEYHINCSFPDTSILGWVIQTDDETHAEPIGVVDPLLLEIQRHSVPDQGQMQQRWLDEKHPDEAAYIKMMQGHKLTGDMNDQYSYLAISETAHNELKHATNELHAMFLNATQVVLQHDDLLAHFNLPRALWPRLRQSWNRRSNQMITGRMDFALTPQGLKLYEYNADSASCHLECGKIQIKWAEHVGCNEGWCPGEDLHENLVYAWKARGIHETLHIMIDNDPEEIYHAFYMKSAMEEAGMRCKIIEGVNNLSWDADEHVMDSDGEIIRRVWKTWSWETALEQIRAECAADEAALAEGKPHKPGDDKPRLVDVLLNPQVMVYEPLWTLVTSNKALLPILWQLFPGCPYLLNAQYQVNDALKQSGYVIKPIVGRSGSNIRIVDHNNALLNQTAGKFDSENMIYQEYFKMPQVGAQQHRHNVQLSTFTVDGKYSGSCARVDPSLIITSHSDILALRVVDNAGFLAT